VTDGFPALALSIDPPDIDIMSRPPRDPKEGIFTRRIKRMIFGIAILMPLAILPVFFLYNPSLTGTPDSPTPEYIHAMTMAFTIMVIFEMFNVYNCRSEKYPIHKIGFFRNRYLNFAVIFSVLMQLVVLYVPVIEAVIETSEPVFIDWLIILAVSCLPLVAGEIAKTIFPPKIKQVQGQS
jgi:Ca2+-transporting ATPase